MTQAEGFQNSPKLKKKVSHQKEGFVTPCTLTEGFSETFLSQLLLFEMIDVWTKTLILVTCVAKLS